VEGRSLSKGSRVRTTGSSRYFASPPFLKSISIPFRGATIYHSIYKSTPHHIETVKNYWLKCTIKQKGRTISDPAFLRLNCSGVFLLHKYSPESCQSSPAKSQKQIAHSSKKQKIIYPKRLFSFMIRPMLPSTLYFPDMKAVWPFISPLDIASHTSAGDFMTTSGLA
jgi:hypothetical protein